MPCASTSPTQAPITAQIVEGRVRADIPDPAADGVSASQTRLSVTTDQGRLTMTRARTEVFHYTPGWELFFFTLESP